MASLSRKIKRSQIRRNRRERKTYSLERSLQRLQNLGIGLGGAMVLLALPATGNAAGGFTQAVDGKTTTYTQTANKVYNPVQHYNIGIDETHRYNQPSADSIFLQRVIGQDPSSILGQLIANGQVWVMNSNGLVIGSEARINTAGFLGTSLVMDRDDFFAGRYNLTQEGDGGYVINKGEITVHNGGYAILAGASVVNEGLINARAGEVVLASGRAMSFDFDGDGLINFAVDGKTAASITGPDGADLTSAVLNAGEIKASRVTMTAQAARDVFDAVVNNTGIIEATSVVAEGGVIKLLGGDEGIVINTGTLDASGVTAGGSVVMAGEKVGVGGDILANAVLGKAGAIDLNSTVKTVVADGVLSASSVVGDGGSVFDISAGGKGGFAEVSAEGNIVLEGSVNGSGGTADGTLYIDPTVLWIIDQNDAPLNPLDGSLPDILAAEGGALNTVSENNLEALASTVNIVLEATNQITVQDLYTDGVLALQTGVGNSITMTAGTITFNDIGDTLRTQGGDVFLNATKGDLTTGNITTNGGLIELKAGSLDTTLNHSVTIGGILNTDDGGAGTGGDITAYASGGIQFRINKGRALTDGGAFIARADYYSTDGEGGIDIFQYAAGVPSVYTKGGNAVLTAAQVIGIAGGMDLGGTGKVFISSSQPGVQIELGGSDALVPGSTLILNASDIKNVINETDLYIGSFTSADGSPIDVQHDGDVQVFDLDLTSGVDVTNLIVRAHGDIIDDKVAGTGISANSITLIGAGTNSSIGTFDDPVGVETASLGVGKLVTLNTSAASGDGEIHIVEIDKTSNDLLLSNFSITTHATAHTIVSLQLESPNKQITIDGIAGVAGNVDFTTNVTSNAPNIDLILAADDVDINPGVTLTLGTLIDTNTNTLFIRPYTARANREIDLGHDSATKLGLTDTDLNNVFADGLVVGAAGAGDVTVTADAAIGPVGTQVTNFTIITGGDITDDGDVTTDTIINANASGTLTLDAGGAIFGVEGINGNELNVQSAGSIAARAKGGDLRLFEDDGGGMQLDTEVNVNTKYDASSAFTAHVDGYQDVVLETDGTLTNLNVSSAATGIEGVASGQDTAIYAAAGVGTSGSPDSAIVTDITGQLAIYNSTSGGIFITESDDGGNLELGEAEVIPGVTPTVLDNVINDGGGDIKIITIDGNLLLNGSVDNTPSTGQQIWLEAGDLSDTQTTLTISGGETVITNDGDVVLIGDNIDISGNVNTDSAATNNGTSDGDVYIRPYDAVNRGVYLIDDATPDDPARLSLTQAELRRINTAHSSTGGGDVVATERGIIIGQDNLVTPVIMDGTITIGGDVNLDNSAAYTNNLALITDSTDYKAINDGAGNSGLGGNELRVNQLYVQAQGGIDITTRMLDTTNAAPGTGNGALIEAHSTVKGDIIIDNVDGSTAGLFVDTTFFSPFATYEGISTTASNIVVSSNTPINIPALSTVYAGGSGFIVLEARADDNNIINAGTIQTNDGEIHLVSDNMNLTGTITVGGSHNAYLSISEVGDADDHILVGGADAADTLGLTQAELLTITANAAGYGVVLGRAVPAASAADGDLTGDYVNSADYITLTGTVDLSTANFANIALVANGDGGAVLNAITDDGGGNDRLTVTGQAYLVSTQGGDDINGTFGAGAADRLNIRSGSLSIYTAGDAKVEDDAGDLTIATPVTGFDFGLGNMSYGVWQTDGAGIVVLAATDATPTNGNLNIDAIVTNTGGSAAADTFVFYADKNITMPDTLGDTTDRVADIYVEANKAGDGVAFISANGSIGSQSPYDPIYTRANTVAAVVNSGNGVINIFEDATGGNLTVGSVSNLYAGAGSVVGATVPGAGTGTIDITAIDGNLTINSNVISGTGRITLTAGYNAGNTGASRMLDVNALVDNNNAQIVLWADNMDFDGGNWLGSASESIYVMPVNWDDQVTPVQVIIGDGDADANRTLGLTGADVDGFNNTTGKTYIGIDPDTATNILVGPIIIQGTAANTADFQADSDTLHLYTHWYINRTGGFIGVTNLAMEAGDYINVQTRATNVAALGITDNLGAANDSDFTIYEQT
ncbi:MAG: filamentous hemagglutinin N-terminal domain-containing protein, partial [Deltaproteobacteria bacterium]|nr:filamentous hemagglutinin N-terminal domain-containing protein [Deltaproteobacteria bacterium]